MTLRKQFSLHRDALELLLAFHPDRSTYLNNLAIVLFTRFKQSGGRDDLEEAVILYRNSLALGPTSHPDRSESLNNLANFLQT